MGGLTVSGRGERPTYQLRLPQFEGPLDVLLRLIERRELEITAISLAAVADQFLTHAGRMTEADPDTLADFVAVGARLVLIKSQALLPRPPCPANAEDDEVDDAEALARQLTEYQQARATALALAERQTTGLRAYARSAPRPRGRPELPPLAPLGLADLTRAVRRRLLELPTEPTPLPSPRTVSLTDMLAEIEAVLARDGGVTLGALLARATSRLAAIVTFLSLLELLRRRRIIVRQHMLFGEIEVQPWREVVVADEGRADG
jgi:segregation and condensation protein A